MNGNIDLILEAAKFDANSASSSETSTTAASLTDSESHRQPNEQEHYSDDLEFDREDISSEEGGYMQSGGQPNSRKRFASHDDRTVDDDDVNRTKAMELHNENERKRRKGLKSCVLRLREQLTQKTRKPSQISILYAAQQEIQKLKRTELEEEKILNELRKRNDYLSFYIQKQREKFATAQTSEQQVTLPLTPVKQTHSTAPPLLSPVQPPPPLTPVPPPPLTPISSSSTIDHSQGGNGDEVVTAQQTQSDQSTSDGVHVAYWTQSPPVPVSYTLPLMTVFPQTAVRTSTGYPVYQCYHPSSPFLSRPFTHSLPTVPALLPAPQYSYLPTNTLPHSLSASLSSLPSSSADSALSSAQSSTTDHQESDSDNTSDRVHLSDQIQNCFSTLPKINSFSENHQRSPANVLPLSSPPFLFMPISPSANGCSTHPRFSVNSISRLAAATPTTQLSNGWHSTLTAASAQ